MGCNFSINNLSNFLVMQTSVRVKFRPSSVAGKQGSLYVQLIKDRQSRTVVIKKVKLHPYEWDEQRECFRVSTGDTERRAYLENTQAKIVHGKTQLLSAISQLENYKPHYTVEDVLETFYRRRSRDNLSSYAERLAASVEGAHPRTARSYRCVAKRVREFYGGDIPLHSINAAFVKGFEADLLSKGKKLNTTSYYCRNLRAIINHAVDDKIIDPPVEKLFAGIFTGNEKTEKRAVKKEVIETLEAMEPPGSKNNGLEFASQMFLLSYYLRGISFIDLAYLKKGNIRDGCIFYTRRKTGQRFEVEITPKIQAILDRYRVNDSEYLLPFLRGSDSRTNYENALRRENGYLKQLSALIGLDKPLTTYVARHSWASNAYAMGVPMDLISQGLGHENVRTTMIYLKSFDYSNLHAANRRIINEGKDAA